MSVVRHTKNYTYCEANKLGEGATAIVYKGVNVRTGEEVAVKVFLDASQASTIYMKRMLEVKLLKKVNHENIVKIIAIEKEEQTNRDVLIMELCTGLSLFEMMKLPQYWNGFPEEEFLVILKQITAAVKHMRDKKVIHRDMKPGNIVKHIGADGVVVYKVADFGTARELEDEEEFKTLCGTEAYLHPNVFAKAFIKPTPKTPCRANVDLWSLGVSLYHIATGSLPFRTFKPRSKDRDTMYRILSMRASGVISGVQETDNGAIVWSKELPDSCLLSPGLRKLITPLIAGLLECVRLKMWSFDDFFTSVDLILSHKPRHIFNVNTFQDTIVYLPLAATTRELKSVVENEWNIPPEKQLLLFDGDDEFDLCNVNTSEESPIFVIDIDSKEVKANIADVVQRYPATYPDFTQSVGHILHNYQLAKLWTSNAYCIQRSITKCATQTKVIHSIVDNLSRLLEAKVRIAAKNEHSCFVIFNQLKQMFEYIKEINTFISDVHRSKNDASKNNDLNCSKAAIKVAQLTIDCKDIGSAIARLNLKTSKAKELWRQNEQQLTTASVEANAYCDQICSILKCIEFHVTVSNDVKLVTLEKLKFENKFQKLFKLLHETCLPTKHELTTKFGEWYSKALKSMELSEWVSKKMTIFTRNIVDLQRCFTVIKEEQKSLLTAVKESMDKEKDSKSEMDSLLREALKSCHISQERLSLQIQESRCLAKQLNSLTI